VQELMECQCDCQQCGAKLQIGTQDGFVCLQLPGCPPGEIPTLWLHPVDVARLADRLQAWLAEVGGCKS
jgi:hypothetical protein